MDRTNHNTKPKEVEPSPAPKTAYTMQEFADSFGISKSFAYRMVRDKILNTFMLGRRRFVSVEEAKNLAAKLTSQNL